MYVIKDVINNVYFKRINNMNNIESGCTYFKIYNSLVEAKTDLKIIRKYSIGKRSWKIIDRNKIK